ncbi:MAG: hypothetical protein IKU51_02515 [Clostridia bacterium]|nr:hypothetical protein [Clostridia bacterium]
MKMDNIKENDFLDIDELVNALIQERDYTDDPLPDVEMAEELAAQIANPGSSEVESEPLLISDEPEIVVEEAEEDELPVVLVDEMPTEEPTAEQNEDQTAFVSTSLDEEDDYDQLLPLRTNVEQKKKGLFARVSRRREETEPDVESWADWGLKPLGHRTEETAVPEIVKAEEPVATESSATEVDSPSVGVDEFPEVQAVAETITMPVVLPSGEAVPRVESHTRVVDLNMDKKSEPVEPEEPATPESDQLPDQLSLEEMVRVEDIETEQSDEPEQEETMDPEERMKQAREEKAREFMLSGDEEESNEPEDEPEEEEEEEIEIEDFNNYEDTKAVAMELQYRCRAGLLTFICSIVLEIILLVLTVMTMLLNGESPITDTGYITVHAFSLALMMGINYSVLSRGLSGLFMLKANNDTAPAVASSVALFGVLLHFVNPEAPLPYWTPLAGFVLMLCTAAHYARAVCVRRNFTFVSYPGDKYAAALIEEENALREIGRRAVGESDATASVAYFRRTAFLSEYLANAGEDDRGDDWSRWMAPIGVGLSFLLSMIACLGEGVTGFWDWLTVFAVMVCVSMQATQLAVQLPLNQCCRTMLSRGGFLVGWKAVRQFGSPDALAVDVADLYPDESMLLHGIKTFSGTHIDEAILSAASLVIRSGGPLSMIFRRIIENKEELLHDVDSLVYEQGMGISGWVDGRRVLVGNRRLLQNHGVDVPSSDYEARYAKDGRRLVYLSIAGQLSAMFVVSYLPDPEIQSALQDLCRAHVTLLVRSCDPNITATDLCESFGLDEYYVDVLPAAAGRLYVQLAENESESTPASMASNGHILGTAWVLSVCRSLQVKSLLALSVQAVSAALGLLLCLVWALNGTLSIFQPLLLTFIAMMLTWIVPLFKRV